MRSPVTKGHFLAAFFAVLTELATQQPLHALSVSCVFYAGGHRCPGPPRQGSGPLAGPAARGKSRARFVACVRMRLPCVKRIPVKIAQPELRHTARTASAGHVVH